MQETTTLARPYAKAAFEHAHDAGQLSLWSDALGVLATAMSDPLAKDFVTNPAATEEARIQLMQATLAARAFDAERDSLNNFINVLTYNRRLLLLPDIRLQFEALREEAEKTVTVQVSTFSPLSDAQAQKLVESMSRRLSRRVALQVEIDASLMGGAVIRAGDLVIDGSVRGKLQALSNGLAA